VQWVAVPPKRALTTAVTSALAPAGRLRAREARGAFGGPARVAEGEGREVGDGTRGGGLTRGEGHVVE
jgi:hypothetical protein